MGKTFIKSPMSGKLVSGKKVQASGGGAELEFVTGTLEGMRTWGSTNEPNAFFYIDENLKFASVSNKVSFATIKVLKNSVIYCWTIPMGGTTGGIERADNFSFVAGSEYYGYKVTGDFSIACEFELPLL